MFNGSMVALITPFKKDGSLDEGSLVNLIKRHLNAKTDALVLAGTTAESPTLIDAEKLKIFEIAIALAKGKTKIIAGTGTYSTQKTIYLTKKAKQLGVDGVLIVVPYYNKPPIEGLIKHYQQISKANLPIILYHHPGRTGTKLYLDDFIKLQKIDEIIAVKEASGSLDFAKMLIDSTRFDVLSGDDPLTVDMIKLGAKGVISVTANLIPKEFKKINDFCFANNFEKARTVYNRYKDLINSMFLETNPICIKYALSLMNKCMPFMRLPLLEPNENVRKTIQKEMQKVELLVPWHK